MIKFEIKKTYSHILASAFFTITAILAVFVVFVSNNILPVTTSFSAGLTENQLTQYIISQKDNFIWWLAVIIFFTLFGFFFGHLIDARRSKYIKINGKTAYNLK